MKLYKDREELVRAMIASGAVGAEVGVLRGEFASVLLSTPLAMLYLVDLWEPSPGFYEKDDHASHLRQVQRLCRGHEQRTKIMQCHSTIAPVVIRSQRLDFVYIDAAHDYDSVTADLIAWEPLIKMEGAIMGHDYTDRPEAKQLGFGVIEAVTDFCDSRGWHMTALTQDGWPSYCLHRALFTGAEL